eukprot:scaffold3271_cov181-Amphora_coffeaeformis.AAC.5
MTLHGTDKGPGAKSKVLQVFLMRFGTQTFQIVKSSPHANQVACAVNVGSPVLSSFIPPLVRTVGSKDCTAHTKREK